VWVLMHMRAATRLFQALVGLGAPDSGVRLGVPRDCGGLGARVEVNPPLARSVGGEQVQGAGQAADLGLGQQAGQELGQALLDAGCDDRGVQRPGRRGAAEPGGVLGIPPVDSQFHGQPPSPAEFPCPGPRRARRWR
jgi:hypothetical protein